MSEEITSQNNTLDDMLSHSDISNDNSILMGDASKSSNIEHILNDLKSFAAIQSSYLQTIAIQNNTGAIIRPEIKNSVDTEFDEQTSDKQSSISVFAKSALEGMFGNYAKIFEPIFGAFDIFGKSDKFNKTPDTLPNTENSNANALNIDFSAGSNLGNTLYQMLEYSEKQTLYLEQIVGYNNELKNAKVEESVSDAAISTRVGFENITDVMGKSASENTNSGSGLLSALIALAGGALDIALAKYAKDKLSPKTPANVEPEKAPRVAESSANVEPEKAPRVADAETPKIKMPTPEMPMGSKAIRFLSKYAEPAMFALGGYMGYKDPKLKEAGVGALKRVDAGIGASIFGTLDLPGQALFGLANLVNSGINLIPGAEETLGLRTDLDYGSPAYDAVINSYVNEQLGKQTHNKPETSQNLSSIYYGDSNAIINKMMSKYMSDGEGGVLSPDSVRVKLNSQGATAPEISIDSNSTSSVVVVPNPQTSTVPAPNIVNSHNTTTTIIQKSQDPAGSLMLQSQMLGGGYGDIPIFNWGN